jgi:hypothetical protein
MARDGDLRAIFRRRLPQFMWTSVESGGTGRGIPDSHYCGGGAAGWVEFKRTLGWTVGLRPEQVGWALQYGRHGGRAWVAVRRKDDELWMVPGAYAAEIKEHGLKPVFECRIPGVWYSGGPSGWGWAAIARLLTN